MTSEQYAYSPFGLLQWFKIYVPFKNNRSAIFVIMTDCCNVTYACCSISLQRLTTSHQWSDGVAVSHRLLFLMRVYEELLSFSRISSAYDIVTAHHATAQE
ncbi:hypothetical protein M513_08831 [Trichuris suis]|uniref:Uncharacterized protein n=1 Tax=Trichuris suis TaxID=68888 RepID=A0A085LZD5_9BILA|nr:hypothetical protein M513_08831 [Trichuris suis]